MNDQRKHAQGHGYMMQLMAHIGISAVITMILLVFLITNITAITSFLYQTGNDSQALQRFTFGSTICLCCSEF